MKSSPLVTVAAFNYNNGRFVLETLDSIKDQTYQNIDLVIVDDCSTDNSLELIKKWISTYDKPCKLLVHEKNKGLKFGINEVMSTAIGKYFSLIATDDVMLADKLENQVDLLEKATDSVGLVYGDCMIIDEASNIIHRSIFEKNYGKDFVPPSGKIFKNVVNEFYFYSQSALINLSLFKKINFIFDEKVISEDWDMELAIARHYTICGTNQIVVKYRKVATSVTSINWTDERMHKVINSHFYMMKKYFSNEQNSEDDKFCVLKKMKDLYWSMFGLKNNTYSNRILAYYEIAKRSKTLKDLVILFALLAGVNPLNIIKTK